jgi:hypothetical protein
MEELRPTLSHFNFFLACPGFIMPYSHNVVEAMSVGAIPVIQDTYAHMFFPTLKHNINAIIFTDLGDLSQINRTAFQFRS